MKTSINLVSKKRRPSEFHKRFLVSSVIFFSIIFLISAGLIGYRLFLQFQLANLKNDEAQLITQVNVNPEKKVKFLTIRERISEIQNIVNERTNLNNRIASVSDTLPLDVGITLIEGSDEGIKVRVSAEDLVSLNDLIEERIEQYAAEKNRGVKRIELTSFNLNPTTLLYEANFTIEFI